MSWMAAVALAALLGAPEAPDVRPLDGPPDDNVSALAWDGDALWVGYFDAGLARLRRGRWSRVAIEGGPQSRWINTLCWDGETLWVGSNGGLFRWHPEDRTLARIIPFEGPVQSVRNDSGVLVVAGSDRVWIARSSRAAGEGEDWERIELPGEALHTAFVHRGTLWAGGMRGVLERRRDGWRRYTEGNGRLPHSWVTSLRAEGGAVWAGTYDAGLVALAGEGPARPLRRAAWVNFNAMAPVEAGIAVGTMGDGLLLWNAEARTWSRLTTSAGLPSDDVTAVVETPEALWVGTRGGLAELPRPAVTRSR